MSMTRWNGLINNYCFNLYITILFFQIIDQIFQQLDEDNNGYVASDQLLSIIQSLEEPSNTEQSATLMDHLKADSDEQNDHIPITSSSPLLQTFSSSPPLYQDYENQSSQKLPPTVFEMNLFSIIDYQNIGWVVYQQNSCF